MRRACRPWRTGEVRTLTEAVRQARSPADVRLPGRSPAAVRTMARRLGLTGDGIPRRPWTAAERETLRELIAAGRTVKQILADGRLGGYSANAVRKQIQRMGLADPIRSAGQKAAVRLRGEVRARFHRFLQAHGRDCTPGQIAMLWNDERAPRVSHATVVYHLTLLGLRIPRRVVVRMPFSRLKQQRSVEQFVIREKERRARQRAVFEAHLRRLRAATEAAANDGRPAAFRRCRSCGERWPLNPSFFPAYWKRSPGGGRRRLMKHRCRICERARRRDGMSARRPKRPGSAANGAVAPCS
ncbi:MAG TPA: hypothetical protein VF796_00895 [Humisphaera sp.]